MCLGKSWTWSWYTFDVESWYANVKVLKLVIKVIYTCKCMLVWGEMSLKRVYVNVRDLGV